MHVETDVFKTVSAYPFGKENMASVDYYPTLKEVRINVNMAGTKPPEEMIERLELILEAVRVVAGEKSKEEVRG